MLEWVALAGVAIAVYLVDCCTWTGARSWACVRRPFSGRWAAARGSELPGNERGGFSLSDPLSLSGAVVQCSEPPYCAGPAGVVDLTATSEPDPERPERFFSYEQLADAHASMNDVYVGGARAWRFDSPLAARHTADHFRALAALAPKKRAAAIRAEVERSMNVDLVRQTWHRFQADARMLHHASWVPFAWVYMISPVVLIAFGPLASWPYLLGGMFASAAAVSTIFVRLHRKMFPTERYDRWTHAVSMSLFPIAAIRAVDRLSKDLLITFHPFAAVRAFCDAAPAINRPMWFDLNRVQPPAAAPTPHGDAFEWYRQVVRAAAIAGSAVAASPTRAPDVEESSMASYCPRCHRQFGRDATTCSDCTSVGLMEFAR